MLHKDVDRICECLLIMHEVYAAESKLLHVQKSIESILASGKLKGQMQKLIAMTNKKVNKAILFC
jgi:ferritin-like metal-binding protein YciE